MAEIVSVASVGAMPSSEAVIDFTHFYIHGQILKLERRTTKACGIFVPSGANCDAGYDDQVTGFERGCALLHLATLLQAER